MTSLAFGRYHLLVVVFERSFSLPSAPRFHLQLTSPFLQPRILFKVNSPSNTSIIYSAFIPKNALPRFASINSNSKAFFTVHPPIHNIFLLFCMEITSVSYLNQEDPSSLIIDAESRKRKEFTSFSYLNQDFISAFLLDEEQLQQSCSEEIRIMNSEEDNPHYCLNSSTEMKGNEPVQQNPRLGRKRSRRSVTASDDALSVNHQRRLWVKDRSSEWWNLCNHPDFPEEDFRRSFRMSKSTFNMICDELDSVITKKDTMLRAAIPVRQRVAVCIWRLATGEPLRLVSKRFGLGISTCHKLILEVCTAIRSVLMQKFLQWPDEADLEKIKEKFISISGIPEIGGSMYTTHVPIIAPKISVSAYFNKRHTERNQRTSYSITVQGVVDPNGVFTDVCIGWPGSMLDEQVLEKSALYQRASTGNLKDVWIVGSSNHPLTDWILVPYSQKNLTWSQHAFNEKIVDLQKISKEAFMKLKGRWSCLQKRTEVKLQDLPVVLGACCVLHNICQMRSEAMDADLRFELFDDEMIPENCVRSMSAAQTRDHIAHNLLHHGLASSSAL